MAWLTPNLDVLWVGIMVVGGWAALRFLDKRWGSHFDDTCEEQIRAIRKECQEKVRELEERIDWLLQQLQRSSPSFREATKQERQAAKPLLLILGSTQIAYEKDREALRRARIAFQRLVNPTKESIRQELQSGRQDDSAYVWMHIASHADETGIELADGIAPATWWHNNLDGIKVVFLAACKTNHVAQVIAGLTTVVYVMEEIDDQLAGELTYAFWRRMKEHGNPRKAYAQALEECPSAGEFTNIRG